MTAEPAPRVSPWWMAAPALLFIANFVAAALTSTSSTKNAVYSASAIIGTIAVDLVLIGYVLFAVRMSRRPIRPTLALVRTPLRAAVRLALGWVRQKSGSVLPGMGVHMSLNALALALALLVS